jgi:flagellar biosynthesis anti-sigma factor FlgM
MKVHDSNLNSLANTNASSAASGAREAQRIGQRGASVSDANSTGSGDDVHLSELVRSLRSLASDSPERQARIEAITRAYASGTYRVDAEATASGIIDDAVASE